MLLDLSPLKTSRDYRLLFFGQLVSFFGSMMTFIVVASIEMMSYLTGPMLGSAKMGIVGERFGVKAALVSGGILCIIAVAGSALLLPKFASYDGREGIKVRTSDI